MDIFRFLPWVGRLYERGLNGKKIMALGESHYCADEKDATPERRVCNGLLARDNK